MITDNKWIDLAHHHMNANRQQDGSINTIKAILDFAEEYSQSPVQPAVGDADCIYCDGKGWIYNEEHPKWPKVQKKIDCWHCEKKLPVSAPVSKQGAGVWVKASERRPSKEGLYSCKWIDSGTPCSKSYRKLTGFQNVYENQLDNFLWLDESPASTPQPTQEVTDLNQFTKWVLDNFGGTLGLLPEEWRIVKSIAELYASQFQSPAQAAGGEGSEAENEVVEFNEWAHKNNWLQKENGKWWNFHIPADEQVEISTSELFARFRKSKSLQ